MADANEDCSPTPSTARGSKATPGRRGGSHRNPKTLVQ